MLRDLSRLEMLQTPNSQGKGNEAANGIIHAFFGALLRVGFDTIVDDVRRHP